MEKERERKGVRQGEGVWQQEVTNFKREGVGERERVVEKKKWKFKGILLEHTFDDEGEEEDGSKVLEGCCHLPC